MKFSALTALQKLQTRNTLEMTMKIGQNNLLMYFPWKNQGCEFVFISTSSRREVRRFSAFHAAPATLDAAANIGRNIGISREKFACASREIAFPAIIVVTEKPPRFNVREKGR